MQRRAQQPITIRSDRAAARLRLLTRDGRSQANVIEEALDSLPLPPPTDADVERRRARILEAAKRLSERIPPIPTMAEFDVLEYDEYGLPR